MNNISDYIRHWATQKPNHEAIVFNDRRITYGEFDRQVDQVAAALQAMGVSRGDTVAIQSTSNPEYLQLYMAIARIGAAMVGVNPQYMPDEILHLLNLSEPKLVVAQVDFVEKLGQAMQGKSVALKVLLNGEAAGWTSWQSFVTGASQFKAVTNQPEDPVVIIFTSGTTGKPKGAVLSHKAIVTNIEAEVKYFSLTGNDRLVSHLPMNHVGGATEITMGAFIAGGTLLLMERFHPQLTLELVQKEKATFLGQVPAMFIMELNLPNFAEYDLSSIRLLVIGGAATPQEVMKKLFTIAPVVTGVGMSEMTGFMTYTRAGDSVDDVARTVGQIADGFEMKLVDEKGNAVPVGEIGEVCFRAPCVMNGYLKNEQATREAIDSEGWYHTGDMGMVDNRQYLTLVGRKKEMYITGGYNVYPVEIEEAISKHPDVLLTCCIGVNDDTLGEVGKAFVVPKGGQSLDKGALREFLSKRLAEYKIPRYFEVRESLPLTPLGKVDKKKLVSDTLQ